MIRTSFAILAGLAAFIGLNMFIRSTRAGQRISDFGLLGIALVVILSGLVLWIVDRLIRMGQG
jgi:hypothetical protein